LPLAQTVLSGLVAPGTLSVRLVVAKLVGLTLALVAGLSVGKEVIFYIYNIIVL
jgi:H+/Cl- antiporter ClcA